MNEQVAIVTGAAQGIGRSIVNQLVDKYTHFALFDLNYEKLEGLKQELESSGHQVMIVRQDVRDIDSLQRNIGNVFEQLKRIDLLVNCAGIWQTKEWQEITSDDWDLMLSINLKSIFFSIQAVAPIMKQQMSGNIINIASTAGRGGRVISPHYALTKAGVINLTQSSALELAPYNVRVNAICPGIIGTEMWNQIDSTVTERRGTPKGSYLEETLSRVPLRRQGTSEEVAQAIEFLVSTNAKYITGQSINVCGGMIMS
jgi:meso-butanediol dehydrogenase / (S,S)-butanediol dehydrogenase / diacetyl reductase